MKLVTFPALVLFVLCIVCCKQSITSTTNGMFMYDPNAQTRWITFENPKGAKGKGGSENNMAKGHACDHIPAHGDITLMDYKGAGIIQRIWLTINDRSVLMCRSLVINMYWDGNTKPAVSAPLGDFFGLGFERKNAFENELFTSGEGRSFVSFISMPFKTGARIEIKNESDKNLDMIFYDVDLQSMNTLPENALYFHGYWHRDTATTLTKDFEILPQVNGKGKYIGANLSVIDNRIYKDAWWGEGEVKIYLDGDDALATIVGTGTEDYISTAWGQGVFQNRYSGCLTGDTAKRQWAFYRYHIPDPIYFHQNCIVTIQQIGGNTKAKVAELMNENISLIPITVHQAPVLEKIYIPGKIKDLNTTELREGWVNFYRIDDYASMAYFYLDNASNNLPPIQDIKVRTYKL